MSIFRSRRSTAPVLVIGAGAAGLAAAAALTAAGRDVVVLEARDRIGGRVATERSFAPVPVELGAELLHGSTISTWRLVEAAGIGTWPLGLTHERASDGGWVLSGAGREHLGVAADAPAPAPGEDVASYLERSGFTPPDVPIGARMFDIDSEGLERWSATLALESGLLAAGRDHLGDDHHLDGGYDQLLAVLAGDLDIRLGHRVVRIVRTASGVQVTVEVGGERHTLTADQCVVTLPIGVLRSGTVHFEPPLPPAKQRAIDGLGSGDAIKLVYHLPHPVFPSGHATLHDPGLLPSSWWVATRGLPGVRGAGSLADEIVVGWATGDDARVLLDAGLGDALAMGLSTLRELTGHPALEPLAATSYDWRSDPFAAGAYSYVPPGAEDAYEQLAAPTDGRIFWAGEATNPEDPMTVHGALDSGWRAAEQLTGRSIAIPTAAGRPPTNR